MSTGKDTRKLTEQKTKPILPPEFYLNYDLEKAAFYSSTSKSQIRKMIETGVLSEKAGHLVDHGTKGRHNWKLTRAGMKALTREDLPRADYIELGRQIALSLRRSHVAAD